jgi:cytochrome b involved in lipid metabolism
MKKIVTLLFVLTLVFTLSACGKDKEPEQTVDPNEPEIRYDEDGNKIIKLKGRPTTTNEVNLDDVKEHSSKEDCWLVVDDRVFDVTEYVDKHPGGEAILKGCGTDATSLFDAKHEDKARDILDEYFLEDLK